MLSKKKSKFDAKAAKEWLNLETTDKVPTITARPTTVARYDSEWNSVSSFSKYDEKAVSKAKQRHHDFLNKYSRSTLEEKCKKTTCTEHSNIDVYSDYLSQLAEFKKTTYTEHSNIDVYLDYLSQLEARFENLKETLHEVKANFECKTSSSEHVFYSREFHKVLHDTAYSIKKAEVLIKVLAHSKLERAECCLLQKNNKPHSHLANQKKYFYCINLDTEHLQPLLTDDDIELDIAGMPLLRLSKVKI